MDTDNISMESALSLGRFQSPNPELVGSRRHAGAATAQENAGVFPGALF